MAKNILEVRNEIKQMRLAKDYENRTPVIVKTEFAPGHYNYNVQFWTDADLAEGFVRNPDPGKTKSRFVEYVFKAEL